MTEHVQPQAVLFDLDGTLVDSLPTIGAAMSAALKEFGHHIDVATIIPQIGAPMPVLAAELTGASEDEAEQINERYLSLYYDDFIQKTKPFDGATELLVAVVKVITLARCARARLLGASSQVLSAAPSRCSPELLV